VRRLDSCINCGDEREITAHGLCFKCYRAEERARKATPDPVWARLGNGYLLREQKRALTVVTGILKAIADCPAVEESEGSKFKTSCGPTWTNLRTVSHPRKSANQ